ncbi:AC78 family protein [Patescibacteria group bacterium]|nr:AC78 family protein [Patescibacteria group bacterium]
MPSSQANVEYFFRLLYECLRGACFGSIGFVGFSAWLAHLWIWITVIGYLLAVIALFVIIYCIVRLFELREREEKYYSTLLVPPRAEGGTVSRWEHIQNLSEGSSPSEWREAIIEADVMLDDMLTEQGYAGAGIGEKLKAADPERFRTLQDAWEAHKVRNQIAHEGSAFNISDTLTRRTIARYESVFREFKVI